MSNLIELGDRKERGKERRRSDTQAPRIVDARMAATTALLRRTIERCASCRQSVDGHSYRFIASHPASSAAPAEGPAAAFLQAIEAEDWTAIQARQLPAVDQPLLVLYALVCPEQHSGIGGSRMPAGAGMIAVLLVQPDLTTPEQLFHRRALTAEALATLRAQCPTCQWILFAAPLQFPQDPV